MKKKYISLLLLLGGILTGCDSYLDINPKGKLDEDKMFENVQGFRDAMYGVYGTMASTNLYGGNLSWGFADKLGQLFLYDNPLHVDVQINQYQYTNTDVRSIIDGIWSSAYTAISYANNVIAHTEQTKLSDPDLPHIRGEAYAVRALLHFDLLRYFADDYIRSSRRTGIPYSTSFDLKNKSLLNLNEAYKQVLADLDKAEDALSDDNKIWTNSPNNTSVYANDRYMHMNKYAVYALKARVYYTMGDNANAAKYAKMVIDNTDNFRLAQPTADAIRTVRRYPAPGEMIFGLYNNSLSTLIGSTFIPTVNSAGQFTQGRRDINKLYETQNFSQSSTDLRYSIFYTVTNETLSQFTRLMSNVDDKINGFAMLRLPEMYYIYSEATYDTDKTAALNALNAVRASRGLENVDGSKVDTKEHFIQEMLNERTREMAGEGQIFLAYKHYNLPIKGLKGNSFAPSDAVFNLPWPDNEIEFGNSNKQ